MKLRLFFCLLLLMGATRFSAVAAPPLLGDVTGPGGPDGTVTVADAQRVLRTVLGLNNIFQDELNRSDVAPLNADGTRGDGKLDVRDIVTTLRWAAKIGAPPEPSSLYYEGIASLSFPNVGTHLVRRLAFALRWVETPGKPLEARAEIFPARCIGYAFPADTPVRLFGRQDPSNFNLIVLQGGYIPSHPQVRFGEWIQIRLKINVTSDVTGATGLRTLNSCDYEEEIRGLTPEPLVNQGRFITLSQFTDPEPTRRLRSPVFPTPTSQANPFDPPALTRYRKADTNSRDAAGQAAATFVKFAQTGVTNTELSPFLNVQTSGLFDALDALKAVPYAAAQEASYDKDSTTGTLGYAAFQRAVGHAVRTALPTLRSTDTSGMADADLLNVLRLGFLFAAEKGLSAERDTRGAMDAALFSAPLTVEQEDAVMARAVTSYEEGFYVLVSALAAGPAAKTATLEANLTNTEPGVGIPILNVQGRDHRLLARLLSGLSEARVQHARRALAVQDWTRAELQCEWMTFDVRWASALLDAQETSAAVVTAKTSQDLIKTYDNVTTLGDLFTSAEYQVTPVGTLLNRSDDGGIGAKIVGPDDYPEVTEMGDPALNLNVSTSLGNLIQTKITEISGTTGTPGTLAYLEKKEQDLRAQLIANDQSARMVLDRRNDSAQNVEQDLLAITGKRSDGQPALAQPGETPSPLNDLTYAVLAALEGEVPDNTWVASWYGKSMLPVAYRESEALKSKLISGIAQLENAKKKVDALQKGSAAEDQAVNNLLAVQKTSAEYLDARAKEIEDNVNRLNSAGQSSMSSVWSGNRYQTKTFGEWLGGLGGDLLGKGVESLVGWTAGKIGLDPDTGVLCYAKKALGGAAGGAANGAASAYIVAALPAAATGPAAPLTYGATVGGAATIGAVGGALSSVVGAAATGECKPKEPVTTQTQTAILNNSTAVQVQVSGNNNKVSTVVQQVQSGKGGEMPKWLDDRTLQIANNTYQMNGKLDNLINTTTATNVKLDRIDNKLYSIDGHLVEMGNSLNSIDAGVKNLQQVAANSYNLQTQQYSEQLKQGQTLDGILGQETAQTQIMGASLKELDQIKSIDSYGIIANARLAADGQRVQALINDAMATSNLTQRQTDRALQMLSIQGEIIQAAGQVDQNQADYNAKMAEVMDLIQKAKNLAVRRRFALTNAPVTNTDMLKQYTLAADYRTYQNQFDLMRFKIWKLARLIEYFRNQEFDGYSPSGSDPFSGSAFNYAMVFRARNYADLDRSLALLRNETALSKVPSLEAAADRVISLKQHLMPAQPGFTSASDFHTFLRTVRDAMSGKLHFATGIMGNLNLESNGLPGTTPNFRDFSSHTYNHLLWAVQMVYKGSASLSGREATLVQDGTTLLRTSDSFPDLLPDEDGFPKDYYRSIHLSITPATLPFINPDDYARIRDKDRTANGKFKNRPLVAAWELELPNLSDSEIDSLDDLYLVLEVNQRTK